MNFTSGQIAHIKYLASLLVDDGQNEEYTRGICELIADLDGKYGVDHADRAEQIKNEIIST